MHSVWCIKVFTVAIDTDCTTISIGLFGYESYHWGLIQMHLTALCFDSETGWKNFYDFEILSNREYVNRIG